MPPLFDAHLDLAYLTELGRDMHVGVDECRGSLLPASVTLPSLREGGVRACLGTIFTEAVVDPAAPGAETGAFAYAVGDAHAAWRAGMRQLKLYHAWRDAGVIRLLPRRGTPMAKDPGQLVDQPPLLLGVLMECADPIESPDQVREWADAGVIAIGLAWWRGSRYAGGNGHGAGLNSLGRDLVSSMDELGLVHDLSHLSQRATDDLLAHTDAPVIASHSNCRALLAGERNKDWQRHLADETIAEIGRRGGIVGLNLVKNFVRTGLDRNNPDDRPSIEDAIRHVEHVAEIMGHRHGVGLGTDMDGGIKATDLPRGIDTPADLHKLCEALSARNWSEDEVCGFAWNNWARFWGLA